MKNKQKSQSTLHYAPDADILWWEVTKEPIDYAEEIGNVVVHFTKKHTPVLIEVLEATKFLQASKYLVSGKKRAVMFEQQRVAA